MTRKNRDPARQPGRAPRYTEAMDMVVEGPTAAQLLEQWRAAERRRDALVPGSKAHEMAAAECEVLAVAYRQHICAKADTARRLLSANERD